MLYSLPAFVSVQNQEIRKKTWEVFAQKYDTAGL